jgi:hypothetical protein
MLLAIACGLLPLAITLPLAHASSVVLGNAVQHSAIFWAKPRLTEIFRYSRAVAWPLLAAVALIAPLLWRKRAELEPSERASGPPEAKVPVHELAAAAALSLILPLQLLLAHFVTGYFQPRYAIGTSLGLVLLIAWGLPRLRSLKPVAKPAMAAATIGFLIVTLAILVVNNARRPAWHPDLAAESVPDALLRAPGDLPIVVASAYDYAPLWWYAPPAIRQRLIYLSDVPYAIRQQDFLPELSLAAGQQFVPLRIAPYAPFLADHPRFLLYLTGQRRLEWVGPRLASAGWHMKLVAVSGQRALFEMERADER